MIILYSEQDRIIQSRTDTMIKTYWYNRKLKERKKSGILRVKPKIKVFR